MTDILDTMEILDSNGNEQLVKFRTLTLDTVALIVNRYEDDEEVFVLYDMQSADQPETLEEAAFYDWQTLEEAVDYDLENGDYVA